MRRRVVWQVFTIFMEEVESNRVLGIISKYYRTTGRHIPKRMEAFSNHATRKIEWPTSRSSDIAFEKTYTTFKNLIKCARSPNKPKTAGRTHKAYFPTTQTSSPRIKSYVVDTILRSVNM
jgi:hypothetical protein